MAAGGLEFYFSVLVQCRSLSRMLVGKRTCEWVFVWDQSILVCVLMRFVCEIDGFRVFLSSFECNDVGCGLAGFGL